MTEVAEEIASSCRRIDEYAREAYSNLSLVSHDPELKSFWLRMSAEEARHIAFWKALEESNISRGMTHLLADADKTLTELLKTEDQARVLADKSKEVPNLKDAFILAYRMEFYLLHPAFELFFHIVPSNDSITSPESEYESHISHFTEMLAKHADLSPELELLGDTLHQLWKKNRLLAVESSQDFLTRLLNRRGFKVVSSHLANLAHRNDQYVGVLLLDLDNFKQLNDQYGHGVGDETLKKVARILENHVRSSDLVGRYGGEEFIVWLTSVNRGTTGRIAENIRKAVEDEAADKSLTVSIGFVESKIESYKDSECERLIANADTAMYAAKQGGKNRTVEYEADGE